MDIKEYYRKLHQDIGNNLDMTLSKEHIDNLALAHSYLEDYGKWLEIIKLRPEGEMFQNAIKGYHIALLNVILGMYQQAFSGLRFFLERTLTAIFFSASEIELRLWKSDMRDTYWSDIMNEEKGLYSVRFATAFNPDFIEDCNHFKVIVQKVYRECSEYVHANYKTLGQLPDKIEFSHVLLKNWCEKSQTINRCIIFTLCLRYISILSKKELELIEEGVLEEFESTQYIKNKFIES